MKNVTLNDEVIGEAESWDDAAIVLCDHAEKLYGDKYRDGRNWIAIRSASLDDLNEANGLEKGKQFPGEDLDTAFAFYSPRDHGGYIDEECLIAKRGCTCRVCRIAFPGYG